MAEDMSNWLTQSDTGPDNAFGHAQYLANVPSNATVWNHLLDTIDPTEPILIVAPPYEIPVIRASGKSLSLEEMMALSYEEFLDFVKRERRGAGRGPEVWPKISERDRLIVMVAVEPHMPADCALSLTMVVNWASGRPSGFSMRVLTVSTSHDHPEMAALVRSKSMPEPERFTLDDLRAQLTHQGPGCNYNKEQMIHPRHCAATGCPKDGSQIVVLFASDGSLKDLAISLKVQGWPVTAIHRRTHTNSMELVSTAFEEAMCRVLHVEDPIRSLFPLTGFNHVHVVANSTSTKVVFDAVTGQLTSTLAQRSKQERKEQLAYAHRSQGASSVTVYIDRPYIDRPVTRFLEAGTRLRRLQISNEHLGGFIAALAGVEAWGIDALEVAGCFVPHMEEYALMTTVKRLIDQGLLRRVQGTGCLGLQIHDKEAEVFKAVLPILDYDHRLAYFVAQHTDNVILRQSKLQLASILTVEALELMKLPADMGDDFDALAAKCWGYTRPLAKQGTMWMVLGLWKLAAKHLNDFHEGMITNLTHVPVFGTSVHVSLMESTKVANTIKRLTRALAKLHIGLIDVPTADETGELDRAGCVELQTHLFTAFLGQLIVGSPMDGEWGWQVVASGIGVVDFKDWVHWFVKIDEVYEANGETVVWGVFNKLSRQGRRISVGDWT
ncbi:uncharacterized protein NECHADRAFT_86219 [Fusarium vanettenii 77-13-4]|uniref:Uncharacterized protein n=1 Tax=Fusarium vanettenii (strain ATCC MYA-4622 / CBS 123669 / FGSC 9596 / NRRL 45880 / 77-13-4) TaxID=660122 RepID=C7ZKN9_FUSV7|nr:uncharacterized protein NECHADRAFT_86219 [Fusarium vanettenii 77-13-4]EEU35476.1 predicted protein [Fusarium vanettenii 77-13-4]